MINNELLKTCTLCSKMIQRLIIRKEKSDFHVLLIFSSRDVCYLHNFIVLSSILLECAL